jgi:hypothetical protein
MRTCWVGPGLRNPREFEVITTINHVSIGVRDIVKTKSYYDTALKPLGYMCLSSGESSLGYGKAYVALWISHVKNPVKADPGSGLHFCFDAPSGKGVDAFHEAAIATGGHDNGKPGLRTEYGEDYYAAFVIDHGYRIEAYCGRSAQNQKIHN